MYQVGDRVKYRTPIESSEEKVGVIEETFQTVNNEPCYWIENEKFLIVESLIIGLD